jgi:hypothetical protein
MPGQYCRSILQVNIAGQYRRAIAALSENTFLAAKSFFWEIYLGDAAS